MDILIRLFWIAVIGVAVLGLLALLVIGWALARSASMEPPSPFDDFAHTEALKEEWRMEQDA